MAKHLDIVVVDESDKKEVTDEINVLLDGQDAPIFADSTNGLAILGYLIGKGKSKALRALFKEKEGETVIAWSDNKKKGAIESLKGGEMPPMHGEPPELDVVQVDSLVEKIKKLLKKKNKKSK